MALDLEGLRTFVAVAEAGGLTAAAGRLGRTVPALSRRIARLESELGAPLFDRSTKQFRLTRTGQVMLECGRRVLDDVGGSLTLIRQQTSARREITVAAFGTMSYALLPKAILAFQARFPATRIHIREVSSPEVIDAVARRSADLGLAIKGPVPSGLCFTTLAQDPFMLVCSRQSRLAARRSVAWQELEGERLVGFGTGTINRTLLDRALHARGVRVTWHYEVQQLPTALGLMEKGLGLPVLPRSALAIMRRPEFKAIPLTRPAVARTIGLVKRRDDLPSEIVDTFEEYILAITRGDLGST